MIPSKFQAGHLFLAPCLEILHTQYQHDYQFHLTIMRLGDTILTLLCVHRCIILMQPRLLHIIQSYNVYEQILIKLWKNMSLLCLSVMGVLSIFLSVVFLVFGS